MIIHFFEYPEQFCPKCSQIELKKAHDIHRYTWLQDSGSISHDLRPIDSDVCMGRNTCYNRFVTIQRRCISLYVYVTIQSPQLLKIILVFLICYNTSGYNIHFNRIALSVFVLFSRIANEKCVAFVAAISATWLDKIQRKLNLSDAPSHVTTALTILVVRCAVMCQD